MFYRAMMLVGKSKALNHPVPETYQLIDTQRVNIVNVIGGGTRLSCKKKRNWLGLLITKLIGLRLFLYLVRCSL